ncbi:hypothetical protein Lesp02_83140 [Lentzea sp. NBRC 105346]|uniref:hypothetical protein n=1 Tax=Lentzea sp. NBRC 105346 TaxID=3032205 RepID=UPI00249FF71F|nr:hypothetical protein [Lentzea sp. NBRC 105346]GLZ36127.1 hypothetical protein Lesp02_83140 [Lentzea sp. NBRC 105346]
MTVQATTAVPCVVPEDDRDVVNEWVSRILEVVRPETEAADPAEACRTAAEAAEELSAYLWILIRRHRRTA